MLQGTKPQARQLVQSLHGRIPLDLDRESLAEAESLLASRT